MGRGHKKNQVSQCQSAQSEEEDKCNTTEADVLWPDFGVGGDGPFHKVANSILLYRITRPVGSLIILIYEDEQHIEVVGGELHNFIILWDQHKHLEQKLMSWRIYMVSWMIYMMMNELVTMCMLWKSLYHQLLKKTC